MRDEQTTEIYLPFSSWVVLKLKREKFYVRLLWSSKNLTVDALVDSGASVSAIPQTEGTQKTKGPE